MTYFVIIAHGYAREDVVFDSSYLEWYDPDKPDEAEPMMGFTYELAKAKRFSTAVDVFEEWRRIRKPDPVRPDGKPNRPLSAFTIEAVRIEDGSA
jgi:hypothetical protein